MKLKRPEILALTTLRSGLQTNLVLIILPKPKLRKFHQELVRLKGLPYLLEQTRGVYLIFCAAAAAFARGRRLFEGDAYCKVYSDSPVVLLKELPRRKR